MFCSKCKKKELVRQNIYRYLCSNNHVICPQCQFLPSMSCPVCDAKLLKKIKITANEIPTIEFLALDLDEDDSEPLTPSDKIITADDLLIQLSDCEESTQCIFKSTLPVESSNGTMSCNSNINYFSNGHHTDQMTNSHSEDGPLTENYQDSPSLLSGADVESYNSYVATPPEFREFRENVKQASGVRNGGGGKQMKKQLDVLLSLNETKFEEYREAKKSKSPDTPPAVNVKDAILQETPPKATPKAPEVELIWRPGDIGTIELNQRQRNFRDKQIAETKRNLREELKREIYSFVTDEQRIASQTNNRFIEEPGRLYGDPNGSELYSSVQSLIEEQPKKFMDVQASTDSDPKLLQSLSLLSAEKSLEFSKHFGMSKATFQSTLEDKNYGDFKSFMDFENGLEFYPYGQQVIKANYHTVEKVQKNAPTGDTGGSKFELRKNEIALKKITEGVETSSNTPVSENPAMSTTSTSSDDETFASDNHSLHTMASIVTPSWINACRAYPVPVIMANETPPSQAAYISPTGNLSTPVLTQRKPISVLDINLDRSPIICPLSCCVEPIFISDFTKHLKIDHPKIPFETITAGQCKNMFLDPRIDRNGVHKCQMIYLVADKIMGLGSNKYRDYLPILVMTTRVKISDLLSVRPSPNTSDSTQALMIWITGICNENLPLHFTLTAWSRGQMSAFRCHRVHSDQMVSVRYSQDDRSLKQSGQVMILSEIECQILSNGGRNMIELQILVH